MSAAAALRRGHGRTDQSATPQDRCKVHDYSNSNGRWMIGCTQVALQTTTMMAQYGSGAPGSDLVARVKPSLRMRPMNAIECSAEDWDRFVGASSALYCHYKKPDGTLFAYGPNNVKNEVDSRVLAILAAVLIMSNRPHMKADQAVRAVNAGSKLTGKEANTGGIYSHVLLAIEMGGNHNGDMLHKNTGHI